MTASLFPPSTTTIATVPGSYLAWALICAVLSVVAVVRVLRCPIGDWPHGMWSKIGWILVIAYIAVPLGGYPIPLGAAAAIWRTRRPPTTPPAQLPYADGDTWVGQ